MPVCVKLHLLAACVAISGNKAFCMWLYAAAVLLCPQRTQKFPFMCTCAGTIVFVAVLLLVTKKQQHFSWVLTHYQVDLTAIRAFLPKS